MKQRGLKQKKSAFYDLTCFAFTCRSAIRTLAWVSTIFCCNAAKAFRIQFGKDCKHLCSTLSIKYDIHFSPTSIHTRIFSLIHTHMHACMHTYIHAYTHTHTHTHTHIKTHTHTHSLTHSLQLIQDQQPPQSLATNGQNFALINLN